MPTPNFPKRCWLIFEVSGLSNGPPVYKGIAFTAKERDQMMKHLDFVPKSGRIIAQEYGPKSTKTVSLHR